MSTHSYTRKTVTGGGYAHPNTLAALVKAALPGKTFVVRANGANIEIVFDATLTAGEITTLDGEHTSWAPPATTQYSAVFEVKIVINGLTTKVEWFEQDDGSGAYSKLAHDDVYTWQGSKLISILSTSYFIDGAVLSQDTTSYFTVTGSIKKYVTKVT